MTRGDSIRHWSAMAVFVISGALASHVHALVLISHQGQADPVGEGWTASAGGSSATNAGGNDGEDYWGMQVPSASRLGYTVNISSDNLGHPAGWTATVRVKLVSGGDIASQAALQVIDGKDRFDIYLADGTGSVAQGVWIRGAAGDAQISTLDPCAAYHTYQIVFDPAGNGGSGTASFYMDGALLVTQTRDDAVNNTQYRRILWGDNNSGGSSSESRWALARFELGQRPLGVSNDMCVNALVVADGSYATDTTVATNDGVASCGTSSTSPDVWYVYTASCNGKVHIDTCNAVYDSVVSAYRVTGLLCPAEPADEAGCSDDCGGAPCGGPGSCLVLPAVAGDRLLIRVSGANGASGTATLNVACMVDPPPPNDVCSAAEVVTEGTVTGSTLTATPDGDATCGSSGGTPDVWYSFTPTKSGTLRIIKSAASAMSTVVSVHRTCPGGLENQQACAANAVLLTNVTADVTYLIRVAGLNGATGTFALELSVQEFPVVITHQGLNDPLTEGWSVEDLGTGDAATLGPGDDGEDYWGVQVPDSRRVGYTVNVNSAEFENPSGWTVTMRAKALYAADQSQAQLQVIDGKDVWALDLIDGRGSFPRGLYARVTASPGIELIADVDPTAVYHTYQMVYDPAGDSGQGSVSYYLDGLWVGSRTRALVPDNTTYSRVLFGDNTAQTRGYATESHWAMVQLELGQRLVVMCHDPFADSDGDGDVDQVDFGAIQLCYTGAVSTVTSSCVCYDHDQNAFVDAQDLEAFFRCVGGPAVLADKDCD
ncbi:MAG: hypothetical protein KA354_19560 [Phycisphaerae bacterium]|nr:hypothetical protein [Phycisphaerae bacterium]